MLSTLDRYLLREVLLTLAATLLVLLLLVLSHRFGQYLSQAAGGGLAQGSILLLLGLQAVRYLVELIPPATLLALMLTLGRLYRDSEIVAMAACGLGPAALYRPLLIVALPLALVLATLALALVPTAAKLQYEVRDRARQEAELWLVQPGSFREVDDGRHVVYVGGLSSDGRELRDIFIYSRAEGPQQPAAVTSARSGRQHTDPANGARYLVLRDGRRHQGEPGRADYLSSRFEELSVRIQVAQPEEGRRLRLKAMSSGALLGSTDSHHLGELQRRLSAPLALLLLTLLAPLLARSQPREGRYGRIVAAILIYAIYLNLLGVAQAWLERGITPAALGLWWVHGLLAMLMAVIYWRQYGWRRRAAAAVA